MTPSRTAGAGEVPVQEKTHRMSAANASPDSIPSVLSVMWDSLVIELKSTNDLWRAQANYIDRKPLSIKKSQLQPSELCHFSLKRLHFFLIMSLITIFVSFF